jgi:hypothetical protein
MAGEEKETPRLSEIISEVGFDPITTARYKDAVRVSSGLPPVVGSLPKAADDWLDLRAEEVKRHAPKTEIIEEP